MRDFKGKRIWIVGASEGIGRALAIKLAAAEAILVLSARNKERLVNLLKDLEGHHHQVVPLDVTEQKSVDDAWKEMKSHHPALDMLIYNSGSYEPMSAVDFEIESIKKILDVNLYGAFTVLSKVVPSFVHQRKGHVVLVGSLAGYIGLPNSMGYAASKAGVINLAEGLCCDLHAHGIKVQVVNPGFVKTRLTDKNAFSMPFLVSVEDAAKHIFKGMQSSSFEIRFPWFFSTIMKALRLLPYRVYFYLLHKK